MGGKHKKSISQMEKQQRLAQLRVLRGKRRFEAMEKTVRDILVTDETISQMKREILKMSCITPSAVALKFNLRLSVAKDLLEEMEKKGEIILISKNRRLSIYKPAAAS
ncbi:MAG: hypothetical protein NDF55_00610 [archaeon GB-1867-005]|nr:hypothetical protein [Candidatus Culexmicrobium cathedralense]